MNPIIIGNIKVGGKAPVRINCNIGCNDLRGYTGEIEKLNAIQQSGCLPDMMMDLSLIKAERPLYKVIIEELGIPAGTVLSYIPFSKVRGLDWDDCRAYLIDLCKSGISFVTIHFTANDTLLRLAKRDRQIACTSRGGGLCLYDIRKNLRRQNLFYEHIDEIVEIVKSYDVAVSLGVTFRPATIFNACDEVHIEETKEQLMICQYLQKRGVKVMVENVGHISIEKLETHAQMLRLFDAPIMPLGPIPTDSAINKDHVSAAIGAAFSAYWGVANVINCVTRYEHSQANISADALLEALHTMRVVAHTIDVARGNEEALRIDREIADKRSEIKSCLIGVGCCNRCSTVCPLKIVSYGEGNFVGF